MGILNIAVGRTVAHTEVAVRSFVVRNLLRAVGIHIHRTLGRMTCPLPMWFNVGYFEDRDSGEAASYVTAANR